MKYILFSDVHCDLDACEQIVRRSKGVDFAIGAGDFGLLRKGLKQTIDALADIQVPTILVPGNHESQSELLEACKGLHNFHVLHGEELEVGGVTFFGIGCGVPETPFGPWTVDLSEDDARQLLSRPSNPFVLITHSPPFGCLDALATQQHVGSRAIRNFVEQSRPGFVVCGHIHEDCNQQSEIAGIPVINAGPAGFEFESQGGECVVSGHR
jgi:Icc-related predicted phosphoesterase